MTWQAAVVAGVVAGASVPAAWSLDFAVVLSFIALLVPAVRTRADLAAAIVARQRGAVSPRACRTAFRWWSRRSRASPRAWRSSCAAGAAMKIWLAILGVSLVTFLLRASFVVFADPAALPASLPPGAHLRAAGGAGGDRGSGPALLDGRIDLSLANPRWIAGVVAILVGAWHAPCGGGHRLGDDRAVVPAVVVGVKLHPFRGARPVGAFGAISRWANS